MTKPKQMDTDEGAVNVMQACVNLLHDRLSQEETHCLFCLNLAAIVDAEMHGRKREAEYLSVGNTAIFELDAYGEKSHCVDIRDLFNKLSLLRGAFLCLEMPLEQFQHLLAIGQGVATKVTQRMMADGGLKMASRIYALQQTGLAHGNLITDMIGVLTAFCSKRGALVWGHPADRILRFWAEMARLVQESSADPHHPCEVGEDDALLLENDEPEDDQLYTILRIAYALEGFSENDYCCMRYLAQRRAFFGSSEKDDDGRQPPVFGRWGSA